MSLGVGDSHVEGFELVHEIPILRNHLGIHGLEVLVVCLELPNTRSQLISVALSIGHIRLVTGQKRLKEKVRV